MASRFSSRLSLFPLASRRFQPAAPLVRKFSTAPANSQITKKPENSPVSFAQKRHYYWELAKAECRHLWHGSKALYRETKETLPLYKKSSRGEVLTRAEHVQLVKNTADMVKLIPFLAIVIIPAAELALPLILILNPDFLPSTFLKPGEAESKRAQELKAKVEFANFLKESARAMTQYSHTRSPAPSEEFRLFHDFVDRVRRGEDFSVDQIAKFSPLFNDSVTLANIHPSHLVGLAKFLGLSVMPWTSSKKLQKKILEKINQLRTEDRFIRTEGVDSLTTEELQVACINRGINYNQSVDYQKRKLNEWLSLSLDHRVPEILLVLSRAFSRKWSDSEVQPSFSQAIREIPDAVIQNVEKAFQEKNTEQRAEEEANRIDEQRHKQQAQRLEAEAERLMQRVAKEQKKTL